MTADLGGFNNTPPAELRPDLVACLDVPRWVETVLTGRPYADLAALKARANLTLEPGEIRRAMAAHPRIGEKTGGVPAMEQSGVDSAGAEKFRIANVEYEARFGHVYLVCAIGRSGEELLDDLHSRMANDPDTELAVAGRELVKIALLRLEKLA
ncbi:2-oxo-4-hydroxy-4-carboxy-5-ureidoimidazoline decarboxylase [Amycolatopsis pithecellobii]|uniref:2-oxo-4-hydroxy-4-carboxy-5-ureidoimidazoline decarboxylase n=1 Tax=Amycolatopsis pithecellobii TaxID=664692 RepID=A0A6N7YTQ5_9PSEU|nr:2-oxo-4-hydroxy-4-carboxy-5-ureidoimidazoline decarboxylase [Amycolatopsis pithecellobii]MTD55318.1 2-oxo-4-hydroxy-4-carboxy-5-ureidoimidazoline decarboxylase [Amycolatopsis pithecellobii]